MKVLIADDEVVSRRLIESSLSRWGYDVVVACDGVEASEILNSPGAPKMAVLDWLMPGLDGLELCRALRQRKDESYTYILLLTAKHSKDDVIQGLEAGADDYITKPFEPQELRVRLRNGKRILYLIDQLTAARESLRDLAAHDSLTKLWNHNAIIELLDQELRRAERQQTHVGIVLMDLDHFKQINDTHGHLTGDLVLREAAKAMRATVRPYDAVGRYGGEEFLIVLSGCDQINAVGHAERLRQALNRVEVETPRGKISFTASFGVTVAEPGAPIDAEMAIRDADAALYAAKSGGRDRVEFSKTSAVLVPA